MPTSLLVPRTETQVNTYTTSSQQELTARVGDGDRQAAFLVWVSIISSPSVNVMPWMTFGN